ncbi:hypothetical protein TRFO_22462 [Tritrichomonas foetus]|uniref:Uncharacterized protein n=1 Tax=Tritrichomonas foetus TaxID=1144522 RepID=A0A1J4KBU7_9EUKA|nr:hypothetical protein TRFO_22462 [Tritrichomonas foetus]|eukprot:OHT08879.1 hypothetical protein TRFO_22462 [Tritrichomonas foetus]
MNIGKPPNIEDLLKMKAYLISYKKLIFSQECIAVKFNYIKFVDSIFPSAREDIKLLIYDGLFSLARDINASVRQRALTVLSTTAPIPKEWIFDTLSKGEHLNGSIVNKPYVGTLGMCLDDPMPEVRSVAISALAKSVTKSDDPHANEVMTAITQLINDASYLVRASAISGLYQTSTIVGHLVQLEDSQFRLVLPVILDKDSPQRDRIEVLKFIGRLSVTSHDQMLKVFEDLGTAVEKCDWSVLLMTSYTFGRNNPSFARIVAANFLETLWASYYDLGYPPRNAFIRIIIILGAYEENHFPLPTAIQKVAHTLIPLLIGLREQYNLNDSSISTRNSSVDLQQLKGIIEGSELALREVLAMNDSLKDACDYVLEKAPQSSFINKTITCEKVQHSENEVENQNSYYENEQNNVNDENYSDTDSKVNINYSNKTFIKNEITKYRGQITLPPPNSKYTAFTYQPPRNFFLRVCGKVTPYPKDSILLLALNQPLHGKYFFNIEMKPDGTFSLEPTISLPAFYPYCKIEMSLHLASKDNDKELITITDSPLELWFKVEH